MLHHLVGINLRSPHQLLLHDEEDAQETVPYVAAIHRLPALQIDQQTTSSGTLDLDYETIFRPSIIPFKRISAYDRVAPTLTLHVADPQLQVVPLVRRHDPPQRLTPQRLAFWGSIVLNFDGSQPIPLPSVAPGAAIRAYRTQPPTRLTFLRDSADNDWVSSMGRSGTVKLSWLVDAPQSYFHFPEPSSATTKDIPWMLRPRLSAEVYVQATRVLHHIGVTRGRLWDQLNRLIIYFRSFSQGELTRHEPSDYLALALSQRGVCRHRTYAFVITAQALGLPARYVQNEAHAFAEVYMPRHGWLRVNLGGSPSAWIRRPPATFKDSSASMTGPPARGQPITAFQLARPTAIRGEALRVQGHAPDTPHPPPPNQGRMLGGRRIEVYLASQSMPWTLVGATVTENDGSFIAEAIVPQQLPVGDYEVKVFQLPRTGD